MPAWVSANSVRCQKKGSAIIRNPQRTAKSLMDIENEILDIYLDAHSGLLLLVAVWLELSARISWRPFDAGRSTYLRCLFPSFLFFNAHLPFFHFPTFTAHPRSPGTSEIFSAIGRGIRSSSLLWSLSSSFGPTAVLPGLDLCQLYT